MMPALALVALKTGVVPAEHDPLAGRNRGHAVPDRLDDSGRLVPQHDRSRVGPVASGLVEIGVANPRGQDPDADLSGSGRIDREVLYGQGLTRGPQNGGAHRPILCRTGCAQVRGVPQRSVLPDRSTEA
jgi:hypothetical protein